MRGVSVIRQCVPNRRGEVSSPNGLGNPTPTVDFGELINVGAGLVPAQNTGSSPTTGQPQVERSEIPIYRGCFESRSYRRHIRLVQFVKCQQNLATCVNKKNTGKISAGVFWGIVIEFVLIRHQISDDIIQNPTVLVVLHFNGGIDPD